MNDLKIFNNDLHNITFEYDGHIGMLRGADNIKDPLTYAKHILRLRLHNSIVKELNLSNTDGVTIEYNNNKYFFAKNYDSKFVYFKNTLIESLNDKIKKLFITYTDITKIE